MALKDDDFEPGFYTLKGTTVWLAKFATDNWAVSAMQHPGYFGDKGWHTFQSLMTYLNDIAQPELQPLEFVPGLATEVRSE